MLGHVDAAQQVHLHQLALDHHLGQVDQQVKNVEIPLAQRQAERLHVEPVAREDARLISPAMVGRRPAAAYFGVVDHIVMNKGRGVNNFDDRRQPDRRLALVAAQLRRKQQQGWTQPLPATLLEVLADGSNGVDRANRVRTHRFFDAFEVFCDKIDDLGASHRLRLDGGHSR